MSLWLFPSPQIVRQQRAFEEMPVMSLWTRVKLDIPSTVILNGDGLTWEEYSGSWPMTESPSVKYLYSGRGFSTMGSDQSGYVAAKRLYLGGHNYVINDVLKAELEAAVTSYAPSGYGAYIVSAPPSSVYTGDEVILSGYTSEFPAPPA